MGCFNSKATEYDETAGGKNDRKKKEEKSKTYSESESRRASLESSRRRTVGLEGVMEMTDLSSVDITKLTNPNGSIVQKSSHSNLDFTQNTGIVQPSAGITVIPFNDKAHIGVDEELSHSNENGLIIQSLFRIICPATTTFSNKDCAITSFSFHRAIALIPHFNDKLVELLSSSSKLCQLNLSGNNAGPVAVRALLYGLLKCDIVQNLDLSDNKADSYCTEALMHLLLKLKCLRQLNLSGNQLGKESLSTRMSQGLQTNNTLVKLKISSCGASNLHGLFEGLSFDNHHSLQHLDISNNEVSDGHQLGMDIASMLKHSNCCLTHLNIEDTALNPPGWEALVNGLKDNSSLTQLIAGGTSNKTRNINQIAEIIFSSAHLSTLNLKGLGFEEDTEESLLTMLNKTLPNLSLTELNLANCNLTDRFIVDFAQSCTSKLSSLTSLNLSYNSKLSVDSIVQLDGVFVENERTELTSLFLSGLKLQNLDLLFTNAFRNVSTLFLNKARVSMSDLCKLTNVAPSFCQLMLDGLKLSKSEVLSSLLGPSSNHRLTNLSLRGCSLLDSDLTPLVNALATSTLGSLVWLDISVNRVSSGLSDMVVALCSISHCLEHLDVSHNEIADTGACALADWIMLENTVSKLRTLLISHNNLTKTGLIALMKSVASTPTGQGLISLDVSSQKDGLTEDDMEDVVEALTAAIGLDPELALQNGEQPVPLLHPTFKLNLTNLGGIAGPRTRQLDSVAIKTDFTKVCNVSPSLNDYLLLSAALQSNSRSSSPSTSSMFTLQEWNDIVGADSPSWLKIEGERRKGIYVNHLPGSATIQRLQSVLEMEADCSVCETVFVKDPLFQKQSGAAWVLFDDEISVQHAVDWYVRGEAQIFGTPFTVSCIYATVSDSGEELIGRSNKEKQQRDLQRKEKEESDRLLLETSQQLAEERAAYREAHPAYQNGRIW